MNKLISNIRHFAQQQPQQIAIQGSEVVLNYQQLWQWVESANWLNAGADKKNWAILMHNHPAWAVVDLALFRDQQCCIPLPVFFSSSQLQHILVDTQCDYLICDYNQTSHNLIQIISDNILSIRNLTIAGKRLQIIQLHWYETSHKGQTKIPDPICKITYTSGTTGTPKGVMLDEAAIINKLQALAKAIEVRENDRSLSLLPLATLLENIAGLYLPLYAGACAIIPDPRETGLDGSSHVNSPRLLACITQRQASAFIIIPQILGLLVQAYDQGYRLSDSIRFIAMGGAPVSRQLLQRAQQLHIPVYEGYGLSEAASVVSLNTHNINRLGSVGKVLPAHQVQIAEDGEILISGNLFQGYLGEKNTPQTCYPTGDLGEIDDDGFLFITGRKKNIINTAFGRNISPEWLEKELDTHPHILQSVVYGHGREFLIAIIVALAIDQHAQVEKDIRAFIQKFNQTLPDYAQIREIIFADQPFSIENQQLTVTARPRRAQIFKYYRQQINDCYHH